MKISEKGQVVPVYKVPKAMQLTDFSEKVIETKDGFYILQFPVLTSETINEITMHIQQARETYLSRLTLHEIVSKIDQAVLKWLDPQYPLRQLAERILPMITGYDEEMVRLELKRYMRTFRKKELLRFLDEEFDQASMLDGFHPRKSGGMSMAFGPKMMYHVFSGNVPGVQIWSLVMGLLVKSASLGKTSSSEPLMPVLFCKSLAEVDEQLAESMAILPWKGGMADLEEPAIDAAETVIVYGSDKTVKEIKLRVPQHKRVLTYGHKISFAMVGKEAITADRFYDTIHRLAEDVSIYDQQSCLSPQSVFVEEGGIVNSRQFAQMLAAELERYHKKRPRSKLSDSEALAIHAIRNQYSIEEMNNKNVSVYASLEDTAWTVLYHGVEGFSGSPLNRTIHVYATNNLETAITHISPYQQYLQSCGLAVGPQRLFSLSVTLGNSGVGRICSIGEMSRAKSGWHHDGHFNLLDLVRFVDIERTVEQDAERYDSDVE